MARKRIPLLVITGQTASGKERIALAVAERLGGEIVSLDSMKVYRGMDVGTAKASAEDRRRVPHHLVDVVEAGEPFSAARWAELAEAAVGAIAARGRVPIVSGGTVLYLKALLYGLFEGPSADAGFRRRLKAEARAEGTARLHARLREVDPRAAERIHPNDLRRIVRALEVHELTGRPISELQRQFERPRADRPAVVTVVRRGREDLRGRIERRVEWMLARGLRDEVAGLLASPGGLSRQASRAVGYREVIRHLHGELPEEELAAAIRKSTWTLARRQMTHLRSLEGAEWLDVAPDEPPEETAGRVIALWRRRGPRSAEAG